MITTSVKTQQIAASLDDKAYAHAFVDSEITTLLPFQIREMRKERKLSQAKLAEMTGQNQKTISDFENPNYARYSLNSLRRLAEAFDVALIVRFAPFSELVDWASNLAPDKLRVPSRTKDAKLKAQKEMSSGISAQTVFVSHFTPVSYFTPVEVPNVASGDYFTVTTGMLVSAAVDKSNTDTFSQEEVASRVA